MAARLPRVHNSPVLAWALLPPTHMKKTLCLLLSVAFLASCAPATSPGENDPQLSPSSQTSNTGKPVTIAEAAEPQMFGESVKYEAPKVTINKGIAADFATSEAQNLADMEKAYGFTLSAAEKAYFAKNKFLVKNLLDTNIRPSSGGDNIREFAQLYDAIKGPTDYKERKPQNSLFYSSDVFFHTYNNLFTEMLKELENKHFYPAMKDLSQTFFEQAAKKAQAAPTDAEKATWGKVRDYYAVPYALLSAAAEPLNQDSYRGPNGEMLDPSTVMADFKTNDAKVDTYDTAAAFVKDLKLPAESEKTVLADLQTVYKAEGAGIPAVFKKEYEAYATQEDVKFKIDYTQFTPRSHYTSSSLRRAYFRGMKWYIMTPFFLKSPELTQYAFGMTQLMAENPDQLLAYNRLESAINFLVGTSDDLMPVDYLQALEAGKGKAEPEKEAMAFLVKAKDPKIKDLAATYPTVGEVATADVLLKTKGMRFFSGKFILDSYWTGMLTQGDEKPKPGYTQKLPPMASSLEVMTLLGSDYAKTQIAKLDFINNNNAEAVNQAIKELQAEADGLGEDYWKSNTYTVWLWTIQSLFNWQEAHKAELPRFMQSTPWEAKTLMTGSAFWTELRHATLLYAKQSFAELGGGGGDKCDPRKVPPAPMAYIEPQTEAYARLLYLAKRTDQGMKDQGYAELQNLYPLENFIALLEKVQNYVSKQLTNTAMTEKVVSKDRPDPEHAGQTCTEYFLDLALDPDGVHGYPDFSDWETLRLGIVNDLLSSIPVPVEGPVLPAKDRRAALIADVHTGGDSSYDTQILYEATGVPNVILTAVKDVNGPRVTIGFTYSHYEFTKLYGGQRLTDEDWQKTFYVGEDPMDAYKYTDKKTWPATNSWYDPIFKIK